jgi:hypothetical protein
MQERRRSTTINQGLFDFLVLASLAHEPGGGRPKPSSTHTTLLFDFFSIEAG